MVQTASVSILNVQSSPQMGYGSRALELLHQYYEFKFPPLDDLPSTAGSQIEPITGEPFIPWRTFGRLLILYALVAVSMT